MRPNRMTPVGAVLAATLVLHVGACGGKEKAAQQGTTATGAAPTSAPPGAAPGGATTTPGAGPAVGSPPPGATPQMVALGDSVFHGQAGGGLCFTCHGADAKGTPLGPPLVAHKWLTGDGSYQFIQQRVTQGMPTPTAPYASPMLPKGGANLSDDQIKAVSAYVYAISHAGG